MPHIKLPQDAAPGIVGLLQFRPELGGPLSAFTEALLRGDGPLARGERELIAAYVSKLNDCQFCHHSHATAAALQLGDGWAIVDAVIADPQTPQVDAKLRALLAIAGKVQRGGLQVGDADIAAAHAGGATDVEIHDTVLIAAAFCMFNRYVDGLGTFAPPMREAYAGMGARLVQQGYATP
jgi:uncharacterized peroxidase-related enzyme